MARRRLQRPWTVSGTRLIHSLGGPVLLLAAAALAPVGHTQAAEDDEPSAASATAAAGEPERTSGTDARVTELAKEIHTRGWIVYSARSPKGDWDLFLMRPDGSDVQNITKTPEFSEAAPRFSHDGKRLLYRRLRPKATVNHDRYGFQGQLVMAQADGRDPRPLGKDKEFPWACWGPKDKQIACLSPKGIQIVDLATMKVVRKLDRKGMYQQLVWSDDGKSFCGVASHLGELWTVARIDIASGEINAVNTFQNCTPDWFPDSTHLIFSHRPGNQDGYGWTQLWMADLEGKKPRLVHGLDGRHIYGGALSPDGKYVLFTASEADGGESEKNGAPMHIMRFADVPTIQGSSEALRKLHPKTKDGPVLTLPAGWEPHWTYAEVLPAKRGDT